MKLKSKICYISDDHCRSCVANEADVYASYMYRRWFSDSGLGFFIAILIDYFYRRRYYDFVIGQWFCHRQLDA